MGDLAARPLLRWAGGKTQLLPQLRPLMPQGFEAYHEPFLGGGAMFFDVIASRSVLSDPLVCVLSDSNPELINCYMQVRDRVADVIATLSAFEISEKAYYGMRAIEYGQMSQVFSAARTIYLNKLGFNGLFRVNKSGKFNVPWGRWKPDRLPTVCDEENLRACSRALWGSCIGAAPFDEALVAARVAAEKAFVFLDPPYVPASKTANFTAYTPGGFGVEDLKLLRNECRRLSKVGAKFMLTNADVPLVRDLFAEFDIRRVDARRSINCDGGSRGKVGELVIRNYT